MIEYDQTLPVGTMVGDRYRVVGVLGIGGFGITYRGWDVTLHRACAIKEHFPSNVARSDDGSITVRSVADFTAGLDRFIEEGRVLAQLRNPGIVTVFDVLAERSTGYLVMEFVAGETLESSVVLRGPLAEPQAIELGRKLCDALAFIHNEAGDATRRTILHLDISPANIMLCESNGSIEPVLIDFGSARQFVTDRSTDFSRIVKDGFSAPELYSERQLRTPSTDVYSVAAALFYAVTGGRPPGIGEQVEPVAAQMMRTQPLASPAFAETIGRAMELSPVGRTASASQFRSELSGGGGRPRPSVASTATQRIGAPSDSVKADGGSEQRRSPSRPVLLGSCIVVGLLAVAGIAVALRPSGAEVAVATASTVAEIAATESTVASTVATQASPDTKKADIAVPSVSGSTEDEASAAVTSLGLTVVTASAFSTDIPAGYVIRQDPPPGRSMPTGSPVTLTVSKGAPPAPVTAASSPATVRSATPIESGDGGRIIDDRGRTADDAFRLYYDRYNNGDYDGAFALESGNFASKVSAQSLADWTSKVSRARVIDVNCDGQPEVSVCNAHMNFDLVRGGYSDEFTRVNMRIVSGSWTFNVYKVKSSRTIN